MKKTILILGTFLFISIFSHTTNLYAQSAIDSFIVSIDNLNIQKKHDESLELCKKAYKLDQMNYEIIWRLAREYTAAGFHSDLRKKEKEEYFEKALSFAEEAIRINPGRPEGHMRMAVVLECFNIKA